MRQVAFASPEESIAGDETVWACKRDYILLLGAGTSEDEAARQILIEPAVVAQWKQQDAHFRQAVEETLSGVRG